MPYTLLNFAFSGNSQKFARRTVNIYIRKNFGREISDDLISTCGLAYSGGGRIIVIFFIFVCTTCVA